VVHFILSLEVSAFLVRVLPARIKLRIPSLPADLDPAGGWKYETPKYRQNNNLQYGAETSPLPLQKQDQNYTVEAC